MTIQTRSSRKRNSPSNKGLEIATEKEYGLWDTKDLDTLINQKYKNLPERKDDNFGLITAPTYYPSEEDFLDPTTYIEKIKHEAEKYGICKIIPPKSFDPKFSLNLKDFKFYSRSQNLSNVSVLNHERHNYQNNVKQYHEQNGKIFSYSYTLYHKPVDLYYLKQQMTLLGGRDKVSENRLYGQLARTLGFDAKANPSISSALKLYYDTWILPYEQYIKGAKLKKEQGKKRMKLRDGDRSDKPYCGLCPKELKVNDQVTCEECTLSCHIGCLFPKMTQLPKGEWFCPACLKIREIEIGFEEGYTYSLEEFKLKADKFKREYFDNLFKKGKLEKKFEEYSLNERESIAEKEFWNLVNNPINQVSVEYGADLAASYFGSGFPTLERDPHDPLSNNPWNLNILPTLSTSMFSHLNTSVSGMTVPWLYVGMCFSTFCWHNEDHYAYSLNYQHWGDTKTWYGIPGSNASEFEKAMRSEVPNLFEKHPNVLSHLALTISPEILLKHKVPVYGVNQRPGEFVITFPKAYHAGFNQGLNFNEAVNFAPLDWAPFGLECMERYASFKLTPIFCHDQLLIKTATNIQNQFQANKLIPILNQLKSKEIILRRHAKTYTELEQDNLYSDKNVDVSPCSVCNLPLYLSSVQCSCSKSKLISCHNHAESICSCPLKKRKLVVHVTMEELDKILNYLEHFPISKEEWIQKYDELIKNNKKPTLASLEILLEELPPELYELEEVNFIKQCLNECYIWREQAKGLLKPKGLSPRSLLAPSGQGDLTNFLFQLEERSHNLFLSFPEVDKLHSLYTKVIQFQSQAQQVLNHNTFDENMVRKLKSLGDSIPFFLKEKEPLDLALLRFQTKI